MEHSDVSQEKLWRFLLPSLMWRNCTFGHCHIVLSPCIDHFFEENGQVCFSKFMSAQMSRFALHDDRQHALWMHISTAFVSPINDK